MNPEQKEKIIKYARFVFGLLILVWLFLLTPMIANQSILTVLMVYIMTPLAILAAPAIAISIYFLVTAKMRPRLDVVLLLILFVCLFNLGHGLIRGDISGNSELRVTVTREDGAPVADVEVDVGKQAGQPPKGGAEDTDKNGVATFKIKSGDYVIYFNMNKFPADLMPPMEPTSVKVSEGEPTLQTIILKAK
jgi:hypothetical protein